MKNYPPKEIEFNPLWFKALLFPVKVKKKFRPVVSFFAAKTVEEAEKLSVPGYIVVVKQIEYDTIIKALEKK